MGKLQMRGLKFKDIHDFLPVIFIMDAINGVIYHRAERFIDVLF
jgi:hypothetical protein